MFLIFLRRHARAGAVTLCAFGLAATGLVATSGSAAASVDSDQTQLTGLEQQIAAQGVHVESLVGRYNQVQIHVDALDAQIRSDHAVLAADQRVDAAHMATLRHVAIEAYVNGTGMDSATLTLFSGTRNITTTLEQNQYLGAVDNKLNDALDTLHQAQAHTEDAQQALQSEQARATSTLRTLAAAHDAATAAIRADEAKLTRVKGNLRSLLAAASAQQEASEQAQERALAAAAPSPQTQIVLPSSPSPSPSSPSTLPSPTPSVLPSPAPTFPSSPPRTSSPGSYANPLRAATALTSERIDQGVDYSGFGPIYAIGDGVVLSTSIAGWPGGTYIAYQLTDGPANGLVVYAAEDIEPSVQVGQSVTSGTVLGQMFPGPDGIETGWGDSSALGNTMARTYRQFSGSNSTAFGANFSQLLQSLGAPGGILQNSPPTGQLPASWPRW